MPEAFKQYVNDFFGEEQDFRFIDLIEAIMNVGQEAWCGNDTLLREIVLSGEPKYGTAEKLQKILNGQEFTTGVKIVIKE